MNETIASDLSVGGPNNVAKADNCRSCGSDLEHVFVDLGATPLANALLPTGQADVPERKYPLCTYVCKECLLVQLKQEETPEKIFSDYAYFSSYCDGWLNHARQFVEMMINRFKLTSRESVCELASNDGYLLQFFKERGFSVLGIEPAENTADVAIGKGIPTLTEFFGRRLAEHLKASGKRFDLMVGNNVLAHVPDVHDFVGGIETLLDDRGIVTIEVPHLLNLIRERQFDTIYHEHFSYFSLHSASRIFAEHGLEVFDVERIPTHGGSLRLYVQKRNGGRYSISANVEAVRSLEEKVGLLDLATYEGFKSRVEAVRNDLLAFLNLAKRQGKRVAAYGAPAKGNTLLNFCGVSTDLVEFTVDRNPTKQGRLLPQSRIPVFDPKKIFEVRPDYVLILPWNIKEEVIEQMKGVRAWGGQFVVAIPETRIIP